MENEKKEEGEEEKNKNKTTESNGGRDSGNENEGGRTLVREKEFLREGGRKKSNRIAVWMKMTTITFGNTNDSIQCFRRGEKAHSQFDSSPSELSFSLSLLLSLPLSLSLFLPSRFYLLSLLFSLFDCRSRTRKQSNG